MSYWRQGSFKGPATPAAWGGGHQLDAAPTPTSSKNIIRKKKPVVFPRRNYLPVKSQKALLGAPKFLRPTLTGVHIVKQKPISLRSTPHHSSKLPMSILSSTPNLVLLIQLIGQLFRAFHGHKFSTSFSASSGVFDRVSRKLLTEVLFINCSLKKYHLLAQHFVWEVKLKENELQYKLELIEQAQYYLNRLWRNGGQDKENIKSRLTLTAVIKLRMGSPLRRVLK